MAVDPSRGISLAGALLAGLAIWSGPAGAAERPDAREAKVEVTKIKVIVERRRHALVGLVYRDRERRHWCRSAAPARAP